MADENGLRGGVRDDIERASNDLEREAISLRKVGREPVERTHDKRSCAGAY